MPGIDRGAAELRVSDNVGHVEWRVIYRVDSDAIVVAALFKKKTQATPKSAIELAQDRLRRYDRNAREEE
jgi:phage-related protein